MHAVRRFFHAPAILLRYAPDPPTVLACRQVNSCIMARAALARPSTK